jgi:hypothetical protein
MNGIPASIAIRQLMATPTTQTHRPTKTAKPAADVSARSLAVRLVAPIVALAVLVALVFVFVVAQSGSDDNAPEAYTICRLKTADTHKTDCR